MFRSLASKHPRDRDLPGRVADLQLMRSVLNGTLYDVDGLYEFHEAAQPNGEPILLSQRRPSVRYNMCRIVTQDSVSMLFGAQHFPTVDSPDKRTAQALATLIQETHLRRIMSEAAFEGSVGSAAVKLTVLNGKIYFRRLDTEFLTPEWDPSAPDQLARVVENYKTTGRDLRTMGYAIAEKDVLSDFWFSRFWDQNGEWWMKPRLVSAGWTNPKPEPEIDDERSVVHDLGFVPIVWIKNLPVGPNEIDGACTFRPAIESQVELEYQLSQAGRGLKYSSDPLLMIRDPASADGEINKAAGQALVVSEKGDAKLVEINGTAVAAVLDYVRALREYAIESIRGNRSAADKVTAAQSGRAMELMHHSLCQLVGELQTSYGESGLLPLMRMVCAVSQRMPVEIGGEVAELDAEGLSLRWPPLFAPTARDHNEISQALGSARENGVISRESAVKIVCQAYGLGDPHEEIERIEQEEARARLIELAMRPQVKLTEKVEEPPIA